MNINLHLTGELETFIDSIIRRGLAANKTEAARMLIARQYQEEAGESEPFDPLTDARSRKVGAYLQEGISSGKLKTISEADFRKKYAHLLK